MSFGLVVSEQAGRLFDIVHCRGIHITYSDKRWRNTSRLHIAIAVAVRSPIERLAVLQLAATSQGKQ
jgi:hypothetical protein